MLPMTDEDGGEDGPAGDSIENCGKWRLVWQAGRGVYFLVGIV